MRVKVLLYLPLVLIATVLALPPAGSKTRAFNETGVVVDIQNFFTAAAGAAESYRPLKGDQGRLALVTASGVYAFLETPENEVHLRGITAGDKVELSGKLLVNGTLLHIDRIRTLDEALNVDLNSYRNAAGVAVTLTGKNLCQCGLDVGELPHSCQLGHRHHLQADDGKIYHYLQYGDAQKAYLGEGSHFRKVIVEVIVLPGQYLLVESIVIR